ncbi:MAG: hypothetical protein IKP86_05905, partial [Anaerolineaceae bacterium]|nr:hypothetical protein [Anaerolineaceae bacterium]
MFVRVLLNTPAKTGLFDYSVPDALKDSIREGQMAVVPFNRGVHQAVVWTVGAEPEAERVLPVREILDPVPVMTGAQMRLAEKISERFLAPLHECVNLLLTDKVRRISNPYYRLTDTSLSFQPSFAIPAGTGAGQDEILDLFRKNRGELDENFLNRTFGKNGWQTRMYALIRAGAVEKSFRIDSPGVGPKSEPVVVLCEDSSPEENEVFSRYRSVNERRRSVLHYL